MYHGWVDSVVPPEDTIGYQQVEKILGPATENSVRLFMVTGWGTAAGARSLDPCTKIKPVP